ncbi:MAG: hypothetical protein ABR589_04645, partial [Chthoniobacterales bacterium]
MFARFFVTVSLVAVAGSAPGQTEIPSTNLRLWFKADDGVTKESVTPEVISWANKAPGISISAAPSREAEKPILVEGAINRYPAVRFNGSSNILKTPGFGILAGADDMSIFVVAKPAATQNACATILDHDYRGTVRAPLLVERLSVVSRKTHGTGGTFDIDLPLTGTPGIECRSGGKNDAYQVVFAFGTPVTCSGASVAAGSATVASTSRSGNQVTVNLTGVRNAQKLALKLSDVSDGTVANDVVVRMIILLGDTTADGAVDGSDSVQTRGQRDQVASDTNFRSDVNADSRIGRQDV